jgi:hypothetical protein
MTVLRRRSGLTAAALCLLALAAASAACTFKTRFWELREDAPLRSVPAPAGYMGDGFGRLLVPMSLHAGVGDIPPHLDGDYLAVAGYAPSELAVFRFAQDQDLENANLYYRYPLDFNDEFFASDFAASVAPLPLWESVRGTCSGCFVIGTPGLSGMEIIDMEGFRDQATFALLDSAGLFVDGLVALPDEPVRGFAVGGIDGALVASADLASTQPLEIPAGIDPPAEVTALSSASFGTASMPYLAMGSMGRAYVFLYDDALPGYVLQECIEDSTPGFGSSLATEDADGDGVEDLILTSRADVAGRYDAVAVISGRRYDRPAGPVPSSCIELPLLTPADHLLGVMRCSDFEPREVTCGADPLFGAGLAVGNLDASGMPEIIVGAPGAVVEGKEEAGSALIFSLDSRDGPGSLIPLAALRIAEPDHMDHLGASAAVLNIDGRDEIIVGMPGSSRFYVFYCSGAGSDTSPPGDDLCRP